MSESSGSPDIEKTDELPVLSEEAIVAAGGEYPDFARALPDDPAVHGPPGADRDEDLDATNRLPDLADTTPARTLTGARTRDAADDESAHPGIDAVATLGRDIAALTARWSGLEAVLESNAAAIATLQAELAASRRELGDSHARHQALLAELESRHVRPAELDPARTGAGSAASDRAALLEREQSRVRELEQTLANTTASVEALESHLAEAESRTRTLEAELARATARAGELERERDEARSAITALERELEARAEELKAARETAERGPDEDVLQPFRDRIASLETYIAGRNDRWAEMERLVATQRDRIAELEREVSHRSEREQRLERRIQDDARLTDELRAKVTELAAARAEETRALESSAGETADGDASASDTMSSPRPELAAALSAAQKELDEARAELARLERKLASEPVLRSEEPSDTTVVSLGAPRAADEAPRPRSPTPPVLVCLTSDEPVRYVLDRDEMRIGRGTDCDIRIPTHFVSREHAGLVREDGHVFIEDRESTNGVFVNAVRVERKKLEHGDWVTIGETQFRFLTEES